MKRHIWKAFQVGLTILLLCLYSVQTKAQVQELAQLALNIEKLAQFKQILSDLKKGYEILSGGYNTIKNIAEGNFNLHKTFLDNLLEVSPAVRNYKRVADIMNYQLLLVKEYKTAYQNFKSTEMFNPDEIDYMGRVYSRLFDASLKNLDDLLTVITASKLRMNDEERLSAIDQIFADMEDK
ncbi:MAG TPA: TerB family tellurite resistance protein, partial [Niabella sp.]|nr:TerB family tellurite resistance protein [Niabella sp.]